MRVLKIILALVLCGVVILSLSCGSEPESATSKNQIVTIERGNLTIDITAVGNLALSQTEDLSFEIAGTVEDVLVEEGDIVTQGQVLARLDASEWDDNLEVLSDNLTAAKRQISSKELDVLEAQLGVQTAEDDLDAVEEVKEAQDVVDDAEYDLRIAEAMWREGTVSGESDDALTYWREQMAIIKERIAEAKGELSEVLAENRDVVTDDVATEIEMRKLQIDIAQQKLADAQIAVDDTRKDVDNAQEALDEALEKSTEVIALFDGFITKVNVEGGDEVLKGTVAVQLADPNKFEADVLVSEMDIYEVEVGGEASVQVDALQNLVLPAEVTHIAPTATIQSGVVNYQVRVEVKSLEAIMQERQEARQEAVQNIAQGELPERLKQAIAEGRLTQEQAEEMMKQRQQAMQSPQGQVSLPAPQDFQLKEGLTVTVSIIVDEANDVLLVPNGAITTRGMQSYVRVMSADGTTEERAIQTGITDYQYTAVTGGVSDGEQVTVPQSTATTTTTTTQQNQQRGIMIPGMGRPPR